MKRSVYEAIVFYMDDDKREELHYAIAPCPEHIFLKQYIYEMPEFFHFIIREGFCTKDELLSFINGESELA